MIRAISHSWALLLGIAFIQLGNGLQSTLLGVRATMEGFATSATGVVMAGYYVGILLGSMMVPGLLGRVGHIRVFAALASLASAAVLMHFVLVDPWSWGIFRVATGFALAGLYVVAESWLNDRADNETRGQLLAVYMVISLGGLGAGQLLLNLADPAGAMLFILVSVLVSVALIPIALTAGSAPAFETSRKISMGELYRVSPLGVVGTLVTGMTYGAIFGMAPVYASTIGLSVQQVSYFMAAVLLGGVVLQWPLGRLSDIVNRRVVIIIVTLCAGAVSFAAVFAAESSTTMLVALMCLYGGLALPLYSLCVAYINDYLAADQMVAASSTIVLLRGVGACIGPIAAALLMSSIGPQGFLWTLCGVHGLLTLFALYRMTRRATKSVEEQRHYPAVEPSTQSVATAIAMQDVRDARDRDIARWSGA